MTGIIYRYTFTFSCILGGLVVLLVDQKASDDYWRCFDLGMGLVIIFMTIRIISSNFIAASKRKPNSLLPLHVLLIASSYLAFVLSTHLWIIARFGQEGFLWYGLPFITVGDVLGIASLGVIIRFQELKRKNAVQGRN